MRQNLNDSLFKDQKLIITKCNEHLCFQKD